MSKPLTSALPAAQQTRRLVPLAAALGPPLLALGLAWVSSGFTSLAGWWPFLLVGLLGAGLLLLSWRLVRAEAPPRWLAGLLVGAALLRLLAGVVWFVGLPRAGYGSPGEQQGYVMADAHTRDQAAWELASSGKDLTRALTGAGGYRKADQYGGLLFLSASVYRFLGGGEHRPLLMVLLGAACSALTVLFGWAFARRLWGPAAAIAAAGGLALYPEAVLLGSSQMREAFIMPLAAAAVYGLARFRKEGGWVGLAWMLVSLLLFLPFSPPAAGMLVGFMAVLWLFSSGRNGQAHPRRSARFWLALGLLAALALVGIWFTWRRFAPEAISNPLALINWWLRESAALQAERARLASGWIQKVFKAVPEWAQVPLLLGYGVMQPFLPAALGDVATAPIWYFISVWRSLGWALLLPFLIYAPLRALRPVGPASERRLAFGLSLVVWLGILAASLRGGADVWDNPRYRVMWVVLQGALAAWVWAGRGNGSDAWLRRAMVGTGLVLLWFLPWYLRRYIGLPWPVVDLFHTLGLGLASALLYILWDWARTRGKKPTDAAEGRR